MNDAFDMLVGLEEIPSGTPGGKKADLRRGALLDGVKHEKNGKHTSPAYRFWPDIQLSASSREICMKKSRHLTHRRLSSLPRPYPRLKLDWVHKTNDRSHPSRSSSPQW